MVVVFGNSRKTVPSSFLWVCLYVCSCVLRGGSRTDSPTLAIIILTFNVFVPSYSRVSTTPSSVNYSAHYSFSTFAIMCIYAWHSEAIGASRWADSNEAPPLSVIYVNIRYVNMCDFSSFHTNCTKVRLNRFAWTKKERQTLFEKLGKLLRILFEYILAPSETFHGSGFKYSEKNSQKFFICIVTRFRFRFRSKCGRITKTRISAAIE